MLGVLGGLGLLPVSGTLSTASEAWVSSHVPTLTWTFAEQAATTAFTTHKAILLQPPWASLAPALRCAPFHWPWLDTKVAEAFGEALILRGS